jgi:hypothetical protein
LILRGPDGIKIVHKDVWTDTDPIELSDYDGSIIESNNLVIYPMVERVVPTPYLKYPQRYGDNWDIKTIPFDKNNHEDNISNIEHLIPQKGYAMLKLGWVNRKKGTFEKNKIGYSITNLLSCRTQIITEFTEWWNDEIHKFVWERGEPKNAMEYYSSDFFILDIHNRFNKDHDLHIIVYKLL